MAKPLFAIGDKVVSNIKATYEYYMFLEAQGAGSTLSDRAVEQYPRRRQRVYATPTYQYFHRSDLHALESVNLSDPA